ncbi:MAG: efflux RND transporter permease subunit [Pirellulales bacterium]
MTKKSFSEVFQQKMSRIVDHPWPVLAGMILLTVLSVLGYYDPYLLLPEPQSEQSSADSVIGVRTRGPQEPMPDVQPIKLAGWDAVILVQSDQLFSSHAAQALRHTVEQLEQLDYVDEIFWIEDAPPLNIFGLREPVLPRTRASAARFASAKQKALENPLVGGLLLSTGAKTTMLMVRFDWLFIQEDSDCSAGLREAAMKFAQEAGENDLIFHVTGRVPVRLALMSRNRSNERKFQIIANLFTLVMAAILFRGFIAVIVVAIAPGLGVFWTMGLLHYFNLQDNPFNHVVLPILLSLVGFTDGVHMMVQIRFNRAAGYSPRESARIALREVGLACALTSLTTAIGFASLSLAHHEIVREFGWCCVLGVLVTFIAVITVIPLLCLTPLGQRVQAGHNRGLIDKHFGRAVWIIDFVIRRCRIVAVLGLLGMGGLMLVSSTLRPDERRTSSLPNQGEEMEALRLMDQEFGGLETAHVEVLWSDEVDDGSAEILEVMQEVDKVLQAEKLIGHPLSLANLVAALPGEGKAADRVSMIELLPSPLKRRFYVPERNRALASFRVQDLGIATYNPVFQRIETSLESIEKSHGEFSIELGGSAVWRWKNLYQIVLDLVLSLGTASVVIFSVLSLVYRSLRIGLISVVPNLFPLAATGTLLAVAGQSLEMVSVCAFTVCLGIAVDDTIHFLTRYQEERKKTEDISTAIRQAFVAVGTALIMTTLVLVAGFWTAMTSDTRDHKIFAAMAMLTIGSALFADLILLPALLMFFPGKKKLDGQSQSSNE